MFNMRISTACANLEAVIYTGSACSGDIYMVTVSCSDVIHIRTKHVI